MKTFQNLRAHGAGLLLLVGALCFPAGASFAQTMNTNRSETATFGGGCFWCMEAVFQRIPGVKSVVNGYAGGDTVNPTYDEVSAHITGHAEVIQVEFDPEKLSYAKLLRYFWEMHDPTTLDRQGNDVGPQHVPDPRDI